MHDLFSAIILGLIEGLTEFLPVSSTGHMILAMPWLGVSAEKAPWNVLLWVSQFGAILAVVVYFWRDLVRRVFFPPRRGWREHILTKLTVAMIPTVALALAFKDWLDPLERMPQAVAIALIGGALVMEAIDRLFRNSRPMELESVTLKQAFWIGAIQAVSMIPGVSRSGASIMGGMALGLSPRVAAEFSFYLAIPTMFAAGAKKLLKHWRELNADNLLVVLVGTITAFAVALLVVAVFMGFVRRYRFTVFAIYRVVLGVAVLAWYYLGGA